MMGPSFTYLIESVPWAVAGFLGGCVATRKVTPVQDTRERPMTPPDTPPPPSASKRRRVSLIHVIGLVVIALTAVSAFQSWAQSRASDRLTQCLLTYANQIADAIEIRSKASSEAQHAQDTMWRTVLQQAQTDDGKAAARKTFEQYLAAREASTKAQQQNPYPPPPRDVCPESAR